MSIEINSNLPRKKLVLMNTPVIIAFPPALEAIMTTSGMLDATINIGEMATVSEDDTHEIVCSFCLSFQHPETEKYAEIYFAVNLDGTVQSCDSYVNEAWKEFHAVEGLLVSDSHVLAVAHTVITMVAD